MKIKLGISAVLVALALVFISQNTESVRVDFLVWSTEMSLVLLVFIMLGAGIIIGWLLNSYLRFTRNRKQVKAAEIVTAQETPSSETAVPSQGDK